MVSRFGPASAPTVADPAADLPGLLGGALCLDFVNTVDPRFAPDRREFLNDYADLLAWAGHAGALPGSDVERLRAASLRRPGEAAEVHAAALALREHLHEVLSAALDDRPVPATALATVNECLAEALGMRRLAPGDGSDILGWAWVDTEPVRLDRPLWPVTLSTAEVLTSDQLHRVRRCPGEDGRCGWLFLDRSKAGRRQWCSMQGCGNRAKARRHYARARAGESPDPETA